MIDELIVHIGPHKTATTAVQFAFSQSKEYLAKQGFCYDPGDGKLAHHELAKFLDSISIEDLENLSSTDLREIDAFPRLIDADRYMVSAEGLHLLLLKEKAEAIVRWALPTRISVVLSFREPTRWLWSYYQQRTRSKPKISWTNFLEESFDQPELFVSNMLRPWLELQPEPRVILIDQIRNSARNTVSLFADALKVQLSEQSLKASRTNLYNESLEIGASMLTPIFNEEVLYELKYRQQNWGEVPESFIRNVMLYQSSIANSMFELGRALENGEFSGNDDLLDTTSYTLLEEFRSKWWDDFDSVISGLEEQGQPNIPERIASRPPIFKGYDLPIGQGFPRDEFQNLIELPREYYSLARVFAANIGLLFKADNEPNTVSWIFQ